MRIIAGALGGRRLVAPRGTATRPTAERVRQALFDMILHASWGGPEAVAGVRVLDAFAGSGALGLEALSRGAGHATFMETDPAALAALHANITALGVAERTTVLAVDARRDGAAAPPAPGAPAALIFLDPPYGLDLVGQAFRALARRGWIAAGALVAAEMARSEAAPAVGETLAERVHGAARLVIWRAAGDHAPRAGPPLVAQRESSAASTPAQKW